MQKKKRLLKEIRTELVNQNTGEILQNQILQEWVVPREEPDFVKLYLNAVLEYNAISCANTPLLAELLKFMSYADDEENGGQMIYLNKSLRTKICAKLDIKEVTYRTNIKKLCDGKILRKIATDTYQVNPLIFGKGNWSNIRNLRASFDWENGFVVKSTEHEEI